MQVRDLALPADVTSARTARRFAVEVLEGWGVGSFAHDVELCIGELVANVVLHARTPVWISLQLHSDALLVEVRDAQRGDVALPAPVDVGSAAEQAMAALDVALAADATTGRGLLVVAAIADELGVDVGSAGKTVWFAVHTERTTPLGDRRPAVDEPLAVPASEAPTITLRDLPVQQALANGANVDDVAREVRLMAIGGSDGHELSAGKLAAFDDLLHRTAPGRLAGRRRAREALAAGMDRFDVTVPVGHRTVAELEDLNGILAELDGLARSGTLLCPPASDDLLAFRSWIVAEMARQLAGQPARSYG